MKKIAITGGLSSGKSTVCQIFKDLGAYTVSSDEIVHNLLLHDRILQEKIVQMLGEDVLTEHKLDKEKIAQLIFKDTQKLQALERLIHPLVFEEINRKFIEVKNNLSFPLFIAEVPLLFESEKALFFDGVVTVLCDEETCKKRFMSHQGRTESQFHDRMMRQMQPDRKAALSNYILFNTETIAELKKLVKKLYKKMISQ